MNGLLHVTSALGVTVDLRAVRAASRCGRSLLYVRVDVGTHTVAKLDLELVGRRWRQRAPIEVDAVAGPLHWSTRSYYVGAA